MEEEAEVSQTKKSLGLSDLGRDSPCPPPLPLTGPPRGQLKFLKAVISHHFSLADFSQSPPADQGHCNGGAIIQTESETRITKQELLVTETDI